MPALSSTAEVIKCHVGSSVGIFYWLIKILVDVHINYAEISDILPFLVKGLAHRLSACNSIHHHTSIMAILYYKECDGCRVEDCSTCKMCLDKPKYS